MKMFRGRPAHVWWRLLQEAGWPEAAAREMATFLTGDRNTVPNWREIDSESLAEIERLQRELELANDMILEMREYD